MTDIYRQLVFQPVHDSEFDLTPDSLANALSGLGIIGERLACEAPHRYLVGDSFLQYLSFMGCSPALEFQPPHMAYIDWSAFTFITVTPLFAQARFLVDTQMARPQCPHCRKRQHAAQMKLQDCQQQLTCPQCGRTATVYEWGWREYGGCSRIFFSIVNVYPKESIPTDSFMQKLATATSVNWHYFYIHDVMPDLQN